MRMIAALGAAVLTLALFATRAATSQQSDALFSLHCKYSHSNTDDPIAFPGQPGVSHEHDYMGNDSTDAASTYASLQAATTQCKVSLDHAGYWIPALFRADGTKIRPTNMNLYYRNGPGGATAFPAGFEMIARASTVNDTGWACGGKRPFLPYIPDCTGKLPIRAHVTFPSCWDGVFTGGDDSAHVAMAAQPSLACPMGFPIRLVRIQLNVSYQGAPKSCPGCYLSSGAPSSLHSDFFNAWDQPEFEHLVGVINTGTTCHDLRDGDPCLVI